MGNKDEWEVPEETSQKIVIANEIIMHCKVSASFYILFYPLLKSLTMQQKLTLQCNLSILQCNNNHAFIFFQKLGFKGKLGYELLLYPNETDTRKILTFLINKLPKETDKAYMYIMRDEFSLLMQNIFQKVSEDLDLPWAPPYCGMKSFNVQPNGVWTKSGCRHVHPIDSIPFKVDKNDNNITEGKYLIYYL